MRFHDRLLERPTLPLRNVRSLKICSPAPPLSARAPPPVTSSACRWASYLPDPGNAAPGSIVFFLPEAADLGAIRVWNFNRSVLDASKGVRKARVLLGATEIWVGELSKASGNTESDYTTTIFSGNHPNAGEKMKLEDLPPLPFRSKDVEAAALHGEEAEDVAHDSTKAVPAVGSRALDGNASEGGGAGPMWLAGERKNSGGGGANSILAARSKMKMTFDLEDPDVLPARLAASRQRREAARERSVAGGMGGSLHDLGAEVPAWGGEGGPDGVIKAGRRKGRKERDLEKSLESLSLFRQSHMGRLAVFDDDEGMGEVGAQPGHLKQQHVGGEGKEGGREGREGVQQEHAGPYSGAGREMSSPRAVRQQDAYYSDVGAAGSGASPLVSSADGIAAVVGKAQDTDAGFSLDDARHLQSMVPPSRDGMTGGMAGVGGGDDSVHAINSLQGHGYAYGGREDVGLSVSASVRVLEEHVLEAQETTAQGAEQHEPRVLVQPRGLLAQVRALQKRELLTAQEGDALFDLVDQDHPAIMALHSRIAGEPLEQQGGGDEVFVEQLRQILLDKTGFPPPADVDHSVVKSGAGPKDEGLQGTSRGLAPVTQGVVIPERPRGRLLLLYIWSTWGDVYYVGLNGIDIYDGDGEPLLLADAAASITANPPDLNVLDGYGSDPRTVDNLMDGVNCTCDDLNVWLAPFTEGKPNEVAIDLGQETELSMLRIWNYNKSRVHAARGARHVEVYLDEALLFAGEIACAPGNLVDAEQRAEVVLFTKDERTLEALAASLDRQRLEAEADAGADGDGADVDELAASLESVMGERPSTPCDEAKSRPASSYAAPSSVAAAAGDADVVEGREIEVLLVDTWGDKNYIGLTGLQVVAQGNAVVEVTDAQLAASPRDLNEIPGNSGDPRTKDKLINHVNVTCDDRNMWLIPYTPGGTHKLVVQLPNALNLVALRLWNYNKTPEDAARGAKTVHIKVDGRHATPSCGVTLRRAPGHANFDFGHTILLRSADAAPQAWSLPATAQERPLALERIMAQCRQDSDPPALPRGLTVCISLTATHGDLYYVGLNAIELYDESGARIALDAGQVLAVPESINSLENVAGDCRTPDKLVDGYNSTWDATHMWLAPYLRGNPNHIYVVFEKPVTLSMIKIWNYARTPARGASETYVWVDGALVYAGYLRPAPPSPTSTPADSAAAPDFGQTIMLHATPAMMTAERHNVYSVREEQHCLLVNERKVVEGQSIVLREKQSVSSATAAGVASGAAAGGTLQAGSTSLQRPVTSIPHHRR